MNCKLCFLNEIMIGIYAFGNEFLHIWKVNKRYSGIYICEDELV